MGAGGGNIPGGNDGKRTGGVGGEVAGRDTGY